MSLLRRVAHPGHGRFVLCSSVSLHPCAPIPTRTTWDELGAAMRPTTLCNSGAASRFRLLRPLHVTACPLPSGPSGPGGSRRRSSTATAVPANVVADTAAATFGMVTLHFTPVHALLGGLVLGMATSGKLLTTGRILGISGAVRGLVTGDFAAWRLAFLFGMAAGSVALTWLLPEAFEMMRASCPLWRATLSGLLVGIGTSMGNGCTSGHGIAGSARLSPRSFAFLATFMAAGMLAATAAQSARCAGVAPLAPQLQLPNPAEWQLAGQMLGGAAAAFLLLALLARAVGARPPPPPPPPGTVAAAAALGPVAALGGGVDAIGGAVAPAPAWVDAAAEFVAGTAFALGLGFSGMAHATKVVAFLSPLHPAWDPSLPFVMVGAIAVALLAFQGVMRFKMMARPLCGPRFQLPASSAIDARLLLGGLLFGAGWGMSGLCPGPALLNAVVHRDPHVYAYLATMLLGMALESRLLSGWLAAGPARK